MKRFDYNIMARTEYENCLKRIITVEVTGMIQPRTTEKATWRQDNKIRSLYDRRKKTRVIKES